jgi:agmatine deiminase
MPAEWNEHIATLLSWPTNQETFSDIAAVEKIYLQMIEALTLGEMVYLLVDNANEISRIEQLLHKHSIDRKKVVFIPIATSDVWIRDYGPIYAYDEKSSFAYNFSYNAWGNKYANLALDNAVSRPLAKQLNHRSISLDFVLEGGSIDVNGAGALLTTEQCLLNPNRNPHSTKAQIEQKLSKWFGVDTIIWLQDGIEGDDTDGHIDDIARFVNTNSIVCCVEEDPLANNYASLKENFARLQKSHDSHGHLWNVIPLPMPKITIDHQSLPASYANFYIGNKALLLPIYGSRHDMEVIEIFAALFPKKKIVPIRCDALVQGLGSIHCVTQQVL